MTNATNSTQAAQIWAQLEPLLIEAGLPPYGLLARRAKMIRIVGRALGNRKPRATAESQVAEIDPQLRTPPNPDDDLLREIQRDMRRPARDMSRRVTPKEVALNKRIDEALEAMLKASCGYQGDDTVRYDT